MTQEEKRIKLAEAAGWTEISDWKAAGINGKHPTESWVEVIPDYFNDLNAVHELEKALTNEQARTYAYALYDLANGFKFDGVHGTPDIFEASMDGVAGMVRATAAQRAEAIGLTLSFWEEVK
jgi:hypothetical protein